MKTRSISWERSMNILLEKMQVEEGTDEGGSVSREWRGPRQAGKYWSGDVQLFE